MGNKLSIIQFVAGMMILHHSLLVCAQEMDKTTATTAVSKTDNEQRAEASQSDEEQRRRVQLSEAILNGLIPLNYKYINIDRPREMAIYRKLETEITIQFEDAPLGEVVRQLSKRVDIAIVLDGIGLKDEAVTPSELVTCNHPQTSLRNALELILEPHGLSYVVKADSLIISSRSFSVNVVEIYRLPERLAEKMGEVMILINSMIEPLDWTTAGGTFEIMPFEDLLVISCPHETHCDIQQFLTKLVTKLEDMEAVGPVIKPRSAKVN